MHQAAIQEKITEAKKILGTEALIHKWGGSMSEALLDSGCNHFSIPEIEGFIGYQVFHDCAVIIGDPICPSEKKAQLAEAFQKYCQNNNWSCIFFIASEPFAKWAIDHICKIKICVGDEMIFNPSIDHTNGHKSQKLRNKIHHAQNQGLSVNEYLTNDPNLEKAMLEVGKKWQKAKKGPQIYLANLNFFENRDDRRWFYLTDQKKNIFGMSLLTNLKAHNGWLLKFHITIPDAPRGASELLMISILETLHKENCSHLTYGIVPVDKLKEINGIHRFTAAIINLGFQFTKWIFRLDKKKIYWHQFRPRFENSYLLFSNPKIRLKDLQAIASVLKTDFRTKL